MFASHPGAGPTPKTPAVIAIQPMPVLTRSAHFSTSGRTVTAIMRQWKPGDSGPGGRCRLCARCSAHDDGCLIIVDRYVDRGSAALFSTVGFSWQGSGPTAGAVPTGEPPRAPAEPGPKAETWRDRPPLF